MMNSLNSNNYPSQHGILLDGLNSLRNRQELIDLTLIVEGREFKAHKVVLSACSDYFRAMFTGNMMEAHRNVIQLNGINARGFQLVLDYAYTCEIILNLSNIPDVLEAASHVQMLALIQDCSNYLEAAINIDNCVDIATIAEIYSLTALKMEVNRFMNQNLSKFSKTAEFYRLSPSQLEFLLACDLPGDCSEYDVLKIMVNWFLYKANTMSEEELLEAVQIFRHIHFRCIPRSETCTILREIVENGNCDLQLKRILVSAIDFQPSTNSREITTNLPYRRGMELALLKIGGFRSGGFRSGGLRRTNDITYKFSSKTNWKHLTKIPKIMRKNHSNFGTAVLNNELFIIGGLSEKMKSIHPRGFKYNTFQDKWSTLSPMQVKRSRFSLQVAEGKMYAVGGLTPVGDLRSSRSRPTCTCECYDPVTDEWTLIEPLPVHLAHHGGATYENSATSKIFICGGIELDSHTNIPTLKSSVYCYETNINQWRVCTPMLTPRAHHVVLSIDNFLYVCGGWVIKIISRDAVAADTIDVYDVVNDCWSVKTWMPTYGRRNSGIVCIFRKIYFIGGVNDDGDSKSTAAIECYDIDNDVWSTEDKYPEDIENPTCASLYLPKQRSDMDVMPQSANIQ